MRSHGILYTEPPESPSHNWRLLHFLMSQLQQVRKDGSIEMNDLAPGIKPKNITEALTISEGMTVLIVLYIYIYTVYIYLVIYFSHCKSHCCCFLDSHCTISKVGAGCCLGNAAGEDMPEGCGVNDVAPNKREIREVNVQ